MVQYRPHLDAIFAALADPTRRAILERLGEGSASISELAEPAGMTLTGLKKHVKILEDAELVRSEKVGRTRQCSLGAKGMADAAHWLESYQQMWNERFNRFEAILERKKGQQDDN